MTTRSEREQRFVDYLLGVLPSDQQEELEERYLADEDLHAELQATADDLVHAYLTGTLSDDERSHLEQHFLASPRQRQRVEVMRAVLKAMPR
jgi:hypothetical protein